MKQNPFSLYDFLGYFIPGAVFLLGIVVLRRLGQQPGSWTALLAPISLLGKVELFVPLAVLAYVIGHSLSYLSSITVEKYSVWTLGYPSRYLLSLQPAPFFKPPKAVRPRRVVRLLVAIALSPLTLLELACHWFGFRPLYAKPLDAALLECVKRQVVAFGAARVGRLETVLPQQGEERDIFRLVYHYTVENAPAHVPKMQNYVALYGFARTLSFEAVIFFWVALAFYIGGRYTLPQFILIGLSSALAALFLYLDFNKFYRKFSLESFMALLTVWKPSQEPSA